MNKDRMSRKTFLITISIVMVIAFIIGVSEKKGTENKSITENNKVEHEDKNVSSTDNGLIKIIEQSIILFFDKPDEDRFKETLSVMLEYTNEDYKYAIIQMCEQIRDAGFDNWQLEKISLTEQENKIIVDYTLYRDNNNQRFLLEIYTMYGKMSGYNNYMYTGSY